MGHSDRWGVWRRDWLQMATAVPHLETILCLFKLTRRSRRKRITPTRSRVSTSGCTKLRYPCCKAGTQIERSRGVHCLQGQVRASHRLYFVCFVSRLLLFDRPLHQPLLSLKPRQGSKVVETGSVLSGWGRASSPPGEILINTVGSSR